MYPMSNQEILSSMSRLANNLQTSIHDSHQCTSLYSPHTCTTAHHSLISFLMTTRVLVYSEGSDNTLPQLQVTHNMSLTKNTTRGHYLYHQTDTIPIIAWTRQQVKQHHTIWSLQTLSGDSLTHILAAHNITTCINVVTLSQIFRTSLHARLSDRLHVSSGLVHISTKMSPPSNLFTLKASSTFGPLQK